MDSSHRKCLMEYFYEPYKLNSDNELISEMLSCKKSQNK